MRCAKDFLRCTHCVAYMCSLYTANDSQVLISFGMEIACTRALTHPTNTHSRARFVVRVRVLSPPYTEPPKRTRRKTRTMCINKTKKKKEKAKKNNAKTVFISFFSRKMSGWWLCRVICVLSSSEILNATNCENQKMFFTFHVVTITGFYFTVCAQSLKCLCEILHSNVRHFSNGFAVIVIINQPFGECATSMVKSFTAPDAAHHIR